MITCPEKPEYLKAQPIGQYRCPVCLMMVMAGLPHPALIEYRDAASITKEDVRILGYPKESGWYGTLPDYSFVGPHSTREEAEQEWVEAFKRFTGKDWIEEIQEPEL